MQAEDFVHLHCHSTYSLLEALPSPKEIVLRAKELKQRAVGLADKGFTYGLIEFTQVASEHGVKPVLGMEAFIAAQTRHDKESGVDTKRFPLTLIAETQEGYQNLLRLATISALEGMYYKPRIDRELLATYGKGLIALSGPISGAVAQAALAEDGERIQRLVGEYQSFFGTRNLYFELMDLPNVPGQAEVNQQLVHWGKTLGVPCVATCNSHYCRAEDAEAHDVLLCIQKNARIDDPGRFSMRDTDHSMRPFEDIERAFSHVPDALENTRVIADRTDVTFEFGEAHIPRFPLPKGKTEAQELHRQCEEGLTRRYSKPNRVHRERLDRELKTIEDMRFSGYFLIVADFIAEARRRGITVGPGRGSAAGSIVSYCLGITALDPLEHGLIFERFLNPERITLPDIDTDFADTRRDEILDYVREKYGPEHVVQICTFGTLAARAAVKDVGRVYGVPFLEMNNLAKLIPERPGTTLDEALQTEELKTAVEGNETYRKIIDAALKLEGKARHVSVHACGVIITEKPAGEYTALQRAPKDDQTIITQYASKPLEALGLLKMDFLGLTNLTVIQTALEIIARLTEEVIDITTIPLNDPETYVLLQRGETTGVFQFESAGMRRYLRQLKPTGFKDITAMAALYRPGPMEWIPSFIKRKNGEEDVRYLHPDLKSIFEETYGIGVYQEQILELARTFAGYTLGEADILRRAIGKKIKKELDAQREKFLAGAEKKGYARNLAKEIFEKVIMPFAGYGFPKAHAAGYARIAYETAYLKANFPTEFMAALLSSDAQRTDRVMVEIEECRAMGLTVLPPDINESLRHFTALPATETHGRKRKGKTGTVRFGLSAIKGIGDSSVQEIIAVREQSGSFCSLEDFTLRVPRKILNKKFLESLAKAGALDSLGTDRKLILEHYGNVIDYRKACGDIGGSQADLFGSVGSGLREAKIEFPATTLPATPLEILKWEKEALGMYVSSHPLAGLRKYIGKKAQLIADLTFKDHGKHVTLAGLEEGMKKLTTKKGETMAILSLEDPTGKIEVTLFPRIYSDALRFLGQGDTIVVTAGTLEVRGGQLQLRADAIKRASLTTMISRAKEEGFFDERESQQGFTHVQRADRLGEENVDLMDEEGNIIAGETLTIGQKEEVDFLGPLGQWIERGMVPEEALRVLGWHEVSGEVEGRIQKIQRTQTTRKNEGASSSESSGSSESSEFSPRTQISIHTIDLPAQAPRGLLLDLKRILETFPGKERVQLRIGKQLIPLPLTVSMSTILEKKVEEVIERYQETTESSHAPHAQTTRK